MQNMFNVLMPRVLSFIDVQMPCVFVRNIAMIDKSFLRERFSREFITQLTECSVKLTLLHTILTNLCQLIWGFDL